jgi:hypothetical protein
MTNRSSLEERGRSLEEEYFRRRDAELLQRARDETSRAELAASEFDRDRALAAAFGLVLDSAPSELQEAVRQLSTVGVTTETALVVEFLPALEVAWQGGVDVAERDRLLAAAGLGTASQTTMDLIADWCVTRPIPEVFEAALVILRYRLETLSPDERSVLVDRVVAAGDTVANAAGGWTGFRRVSTAERRVLHNVRAALVTRAS